MFKSTTRNYTGCCTVHQIIIKKFLLFFFISYELGGKEIDFNDKKNNKKYKSKKLFKIKGIDINKILISEAESYGKNNSKKYIIGYSGDVIRPLCILFPQMTGFDDNKTVSFVDDK